MKPTLGCDVDSTVWDTATWVREAVLEVTGEAPNLDAISGERTSSKPMGRRRRRRSSTAFSPPKGFTSANLTPVR